MEGSSFAFADIFEQVRRRAGEPAFIGVTGSGTASRVWTGLLADLVQHPLELTDMASEGRGAAVFCAVAIGEYPTLEAAVANMVHPGRTVHPTGTDLSTARQQWQAFCDILRR